MAQLKLQTSLLNADVFCLFKENGEEISLPDESGWEIFYPETNGGLDSPGYFPDPDKKLLLTLEPGKYWLIKSTNNVTTVKRVTADESSIQKEEVGGVANGCPHQEAEVGKVVLATPRPVFDQFLKLGELAP